MMSDRWVKQYEMFEAPTVMKTGRGDRTLIRLHKKWSRLLLIYVKEKEEDTTMAEKFHRVI